MSNVIGTDVKVTLTASALEAYRECVTLIANARDWAMCADLSYEEIAGDNHKAGERIVEERRKKVDEMERSFYTNFAQLMTMSQGWKEDGQFEGIRIMRDTEACFYWQHASGYHGGLIFHRDGSLSNPGDPLTIGTWSIHT